MTIPFRIQLVGGDVFAVLVAILMFQLNGKALAFGDHNRKILNEFRTHYETTRIADMEEYFKPQGI